MPEGPELHLSSQFINSICKGRIFAGKVRRNPIHKCADVVWDAAAYTISAVSRGKELKVFLQSLKSEKDIKPKIENGVAVSEKDSPEKLEILFKFGMSGKFEFTSSTSSQMPKHAHLSFYTKTEPSMALSFVDYRRFGRWEVGADWTSDRGPCVLFEYPQFRSNVLKNLSNSAFNKPVCETLLNQKYFNGIGNYLRAEICFRGGVRPFEQARSVFAALPDVPEDVKVKMEGVVSQPVKVKAEAEADILQLCNTIALEVVGLGTSLYLPEDEYSEMSKFSQWLQCYYKPGMKNVTDHNKRTMWFHGDPGPMLPKEGGSRKRHGLYDKKLTKNGKKVKKEENQEEEESEPTATKSCTKKVTKTKQSSKKEQPTSPAKTRRMTRKAIETLPDKPASAKKTTKRKTAKTVEDDLVKSSEDAHTNSKKKLSAVKGRAKKAKGAIPEQGNAEATVIPKGRKTAMRASVTKSINNTREAGTEPSEKKKSRK